MSNGKHLLLLGAGASYGSEPTGRPVPPLAKDLFDELVKFERGVWGSVPADIAAMFRSDFEKGMIAMSERHPHALPSMQRAMGAFFYLFAPSGKSLYRRLARKISASNWKGALATLNYERMLLMALASEGVRTIVGGGEDSELCLPHGCCHLFCEGVRGVAFAISADGMAVSTNGPVTFVDHPDQFWPRIRHDAFPPVMSYFEPNKHTMSGANFIVAQRARLTEHLRDATKVSVVGVHVREQDAHIWGALADTDASIFYCSGKQGADAFELWQKRVRAPKAERDVVARSYWNDSFDDISDHLGMS